MRTIEKDDLEALSTGAWILGTGGGGMPYSAYLNVRAHYEAGGTVTLIDPDELDDGDLVAVVSTMGAPIVLLERTTDPEQALKPVRLLEEHIGTPFRAVMAVEIGGSNAFQPLLVAAASGLPVVDADAMGRAFPSADMTSFAIAGLSNYPTSVSDIRDNGVVVSKAATWKWMEQIRRNICMEFGSLAATCHAPRTGAEVKQFGIRGTTSFAIALGRAVQKARQAHEDPIAATVNAADGKLLFAGKIQDVQRETTGGYLRGVVGIAGLDGDAGRELKIAFQNEFSVAWVDGEVAVSTPDLICVLDSISGEAIGTESLRYGQRVSVVALPSPALHRTPKGLLHVGPRAFGYDIDHVSVFEPQLELSA